MVIERTLIALKGNGKSASDGKHHQTLCLSLGVAKNVDNLFLTRYRHTDVMITANLAVADCSKVFGDAKMTIALLDRLTHHCHIV